MISFYGAVVTLTQRFFFNRTTLQTFHHPRALLISSGNCHQSKLNKTWLSFTAFRFSLSLFRLSSKISFQNCLELGTKRFQYSFPQSTNFLVLFCCCHPRRTPHQDDMAQCEVRLAGWPKKVCRSQFAFCLRSLDIWIGIYRVSDRKTISVKAIFLLFKSPRVYTKKGKSSTRQIVSSSWLDLRQYDNETIYSMQTNTITLSRERCNFIVFGKR